jgi:hypothetical protein
MVDPYKGASQADVSYRRRREAVAERLGRCRVGTADEDANRRWWCLADLHAAIGGREWLRPPTMDRFCREFVAALEAGSFDHRKTRVALLDPQAPIDSRAPWPQLRLTADRARQQFDAHGWWQFSARYGLFVCVKIDRAHDWLATWLEPTHFTAWYSRVLPDLAVATRLNAATHTTAAGREPVIDSTDTSSMMPRCCSAVSAQQRRTRRLCNVRNGSAHSFGPAITCLTRTRKKSLKRRGPQSARNSAAALSTFAWMSEAPAEWRRAGRRRGST